jgi:hypothetical protein
MNVPSWAFYSILFLIVVWLIHRLQRVLEDESNPIEWWQFISSRGKDGKQYGDMTRLGQATGIVLCFFVTLYLVTKIDDSGWLGFCGVLTIVLTYLGGVQAFQTYIKNKNQPLVTPPVVQPDEDKP